MANLWKTRISSSETIEGISKKLGKIDGSVNRFDDTVGKWIGLFLTIRKTIFLITSFFVCFVSAASLPAPYHLFLSLIAGGAGIWFAYEIYQINKNPISAKAEIENQFRRRTIPIRILIRGLAQRKNIKR